MTGANETQPETSVLAAAPAATAHPSSVPDAAQVTPAATTVSSTTQTRERAAAPEPAGPARYSWLTSVIWWLMAVLVRCIYRLEIHGRENIPKRGPVLLTMNHVTYADGNLILATCPRLVRFLLWAKLYESPFLRWLGHLFHMIPIKQDSPRDVIRALQDCSQVLQNGEVLAIFPEGSLTRLGILLPFFRGFEKVLQRANAEVTVIPGYIDGSWGSIFSFHRGRFFWRWPKEWFPVIRVIYGKPLPATISADQLREEILLLGAQAFELRKKHFRPLPEEFIQRARRHPRAPYVADSLTPMLSYGAALMRSVVLSRLLQRRLGPEKHVGLLLPPSVGGSLANIATYYTGRLPVNLNYTIGNEALNNCIQQAGIKQIITSKAFALKIKLKPDAEMLYLEELREEVHWTDKFWSVVARIGPAWLTRWWLLTGPRAKVDDVATIVFSSGSTGQPKGIQLTHTNIITDAQGGIQMLDALPTECFMGVLPLFHSFGFTGTLWIPILCDARAVFHYSPLEVEKVAELIEQYKATIFFSTATFIRMHYRKNQPEQLASLRYLICGAEKVPVPLIEQFREKFGITIMEGYGCTELSPITNVNRHNVEITNSVQVGNKVGTIGHTLPGQVARVVDPETGLRLPLGEEGMLMIKGPNVMKGYYNQPEKTAEVILDGWYITGDIAKLDRDGFVTITDRLSRFSKIGGEMVPHGKIEEAIHQVLNIKDDILVIVTSIPDERKGEQLAVLHKELPIAPAALRDKLQAHGVPPLWLPNATNFVLVEELPVLGSGKLDLRSARKIALERLSGN